MGDKLSQSYFFGEREEPLIYQTIGNYLDRVTNSFPDHEALVVAHQNIRWSFSEYRAEVDRLATGLLTLDINVGDRVGIWAPNCYEWCLTQMATAKIGAVMVCINPAYRIYELEHALNKVGCLALITAQSFKTTNYLKILQQLAPELNLCEAGQLKAKRVPQLQKVIRMNDASTPGMFNFSSICEQGGEIEYQRLEALKSELQPDDAINIQFTSGTTGKPKGATLSHFNLLNNGYQVARRMNFSELDRLCIPVPLYHCFGMVMGNLACLSHAATAVLPSETFDPLLTLRTVVAEKCSALHGVPTMFIALLSHPDFGKFDLSSLRTGIMAGALCPAEIMKRVISDMSMSEVTIMYGQTETSPVNHMTALDDPIEKRVHTVGRIGPHLETKIVDKSNRVVPIGEKGELCCRGYSVMKGYWGDQQKTRETIDDAGWLHSGDLAIMDEDGYAQIVGRIKDMIIRGGENIYPREVEDFLYTHPSVKAVEVFGITDIKFGEEICAWIQLHEDEILTANDIRQYCQDNIAYFKIPRDIRFVDDFPMTVTGKVKKYIMREIMENE